MSPSNLSTGCPFTTLDFSLLALLMNSDATPGEVPAAANQSPGCRAVPHPCYPFPMPMQPAEGEQNILLAFAEKIVHARLIRLCMANSPL
jgi:hypothetical protein